MFKRNTIWKYVICLGVFCAGFRAPSEVESADELAQWMKNNLPSYSREDVDSLISKINSESKTSKLTPAELESKLTVAKTLGTKFYLVEADGCMGAISGIGDRILEIQDELNTLRGMENPHQNSINRYNQELNQKMTEKADKIAKLRELLGDIQEVALDEHGKKRLKNLRANLKAVEPKAGLLGSAISSAKKALVG